MVPFLIGALGAAVGAVAGVLTTHAAGENKRQEASRQKKIANEILEKYRDVQKRYDDYREASKRQIKDLEDKLSDSELQKDILYIAVRLQNVLISHMNELGKESSCEVMTQIRDAVLQVNLFLAQLDENLVKLDATYFIENIRRIESSSLTDIEFASYYYLLGQIFHEDLNDCKEAIFYYNKALEIQPKNYKYWISKGDALIGIGHYKEALLSYSTAISIEISDPNVWYAQSRAYHLLGDLEGEQKALRVVLALDASYAKTLYVRGVLFEKLEAKLQAIECYAQALEIEPTIAEAYHRRGLLRLSLGDPLSEQHYMKFRDNGRKDLEKARKLFIQQGKKIPLPPESFCNLSLLSAFSVPSF